MKAKKCIAHNTKCDSKHLKGFSNDENGLIQYSNKLHEFQNLLSKQFTGYLGT